MIGQECAALFDNADQRAWQPERQFWVAVIARAIQDWYSYHDKYKRDLNRFFFLEDESDITCLCGIAALIEVPAGFVRNVRILILEREGVADGRAANRDARLYRIS